MRYYKVPFFLFWSVLMLVPALGMAAADAPACFRVLETNFFPESLVQEALNLYQVPQGVWTQVSGDLRTRSQQVPMRLKKKTDFMVHNPLNYPFQKEQAAKLLKQTLYEVFVESMQLFQVNEQPTVDLVFNYIFMKQLPKIEACLGIKGGTLQTNFD